MHSAGKELEPCNINDGKLDTNGLDLFCFIHVPTLHVLSLKYVYVP